MGTVLRMKRTTDFLRRPVWALVTEATEDGHGGAAHASAGQQDGCCHPRFCMSVTVLGGHLSGMGVLDPDAWRLFVWDIVHTKEVE